jgi:hypothetical protein
MPEQTNFEPTIILSRCLTDPALFGNTFASASFWTWKTVAKVIDGIPLTERREIDLFEQCTGRTKLSDKPVKRLIILVGRRGGKDRFLSAVAVWRAALCADWRQYASAGEQMAVILLGRDRRQAAILRRYCQGLLQAPLLAREVTRETSEVIEFRCGSSLEIASNDASLVRGRSAAGILGSESNHWKHDPASSSNDEEVMAAAEPSLSMCPDGGVLILGSSVSRKRGYCYRRFKELHGNDNADDICWFAASRVMNPRLPQHVVDKALAEDRPRFSAEYLNIWREDVSDCFPDDAVAAVTADVWERPPVPGTSYISAADAATGTGQDSFALAICHRDPGTNIVTLDVLRERKPRFVCFDVIRDYSQLLKQYGVSEIYADSYAKGIIADEFARNGVTFRDSENTTSENYLRALPLIMGRRVVLLNNAILRQQLTSLERYVASGQTPASSFGPRRFSRSGVYGHRHRQQPF